MSEAPEHETSPEDKAAAMAARMAAVRAARASSKPAAPEAAATSPVAERAPDLEPPVAEELPAGPTILERVAANEEQKRQAKIAALRAAKVAGVDPVADPLVTVRILKRGAGMISMGEHISGLGDLTYDAGETPQLPRTIAQSLEDRGLVEIQ